MKTCGLTLLTRLYRPRSKLLGRFPHVSSWNQKSTTLFCNNWLTDIYHKFSTIKSSVSSPVCFMKAWFRRDSLRIKQIHTQLTMWSLDSKVKLFRWTFHLFYIYSMIIDMMFMPYNLSSSFTRWLHFGENYMYQLQPQIM